MKQEPILWSMYLPDELWMDGKPNAEVCAEVLGKREHVKHVIQNGEV